MANKFIRISDSIGDNTWLTPPYLIDKLGEFDLDPCCPPDMPWRTAKVMNHFPPNDGLKIEWFGRVWCNPPYSKILPWAEKMASHRNGMMLVPAYATDTRWGQLILNSCDSAFFIKGRLQFFKVDKTPSKHKWIPNMICAFGGNNHEILKNIKKYVDGVFLIKD